MKIQLLFLLVILISCKISSQQCSQLQNGIYDVEYDSAYKDSPARRFEIDNDICYIIRDGKRKKYEIKKPAPCTFWLYDSAFMDETKLTGLQKDLRLNKQIPLYEISKGVGSTYYFVLTVNTDMILFSGKFNRVNQ